MTLRTMAELEISSINIDKRYQRSVNMDRVKRMFAKFQPACLKAVSVSKRADGSFNAYDGMHTIELCKMAGHKTVLCVVVEGDSESESKWFSLMNGPGVLKARPHEIQVAELHHHDPIAEDAQSTLDSYGLKMAKGGKRKGETSAIDLIKRYTKMDKPRLISAMDLIDRLWSEEVDAWTQVMIRGFWEIAGTGIIDSVEQRLIKYKVKPSLILATASGIQVGSGGTGGGAAYIKKAILKLAKIKE